MKKRWFQLIHNFENIITGFLLCTIITLLFIQVIARYVFGSAFSWTEEIARFGFLAMVYISASIGIQRGSHIRINAHILRLPEPLQKIIFLMGDIVWVTFNLFVIYHSALLIASMNERPLISGALMLDMKYIFVLIPIGFTLQTIRIIERWLPRKRGDELVS